MISWTDRVWFFKSIHYFLSEIEKKVDKILRAYIIYFDECNMVNKFLNVMIRIKY